MNARSGPERVTVATFAEMKRSGDPIVMVTAYDAPSARVAEAAGADAILVGDSLGMVVLGHPTTLPVTLDDMVRHAAAVARTVTRPLVVADMPFGSYQASPDDAVANAVRLLAEAGAAAVKIEGGRHVAPLVERMVAAGIPVMGHLGLTPQSVNVFGGYRVRAKEAAEAIGLVEDALALEAAGAFAVVLELVPAEVAAIVTEELEIPTIGIGAGADCDGQVQVFHDLVGLSGFTPRHAKRYLDAERLMTEALAEYVQGVRSGSFPAEENASHASEDVVAELETALPIARGRDDEGM
ncbi:MAG: 3-methyl-2-oxobutanoate hydroxymethyltransferase [Anaerosomatales bacterium]|nr:3-methyl-2-oxobutanoate hydroxymethyltransferase [Anaerosomatales bacterium]